MERKVIQMGSSSLVISLPKKWVEKSGVKKGGTIVLEEIPTGELIVKPRKKLAEKRSVRIEEGDLEKALFTAYINGGDEISISPDFPMDTIYGLLGDYMGLEVTKAGQDGILIEYYGEPVPPKKLLGRFSIIAGNYLNALVASFRERQELPLLNIKKVREKDRLYNAILRNLLLASGNTALASDLEVSSRDIVTFTLLAGGYRDLVSIVEKIEYQETEYDQRFYGFFREILEVFQRSMKVWSGKGPGLSPELFERIEMVSREVRSAKNEILRQRPAKKERGFLLMEDVMESKAERMRGLVATPEDVYLKELLDDVLAILAGLRKNLEVFTLRVPP
jgi:phosphate uptake regulator